LKEELENLQKNTDEPKNDKGKIVKENKKKKENTDLPKKPSNFGLTFSSIYTGLMLFSSSLKCYLI